MISRVLSVSLRNHFKPNQLIARLRPECWPTVAVRAITTSPKKKGDSHDSIPSYVPGFMDGQPRGPQTVKEFADVSTQKVLTLE